MTGVVLRIPLSEAEAHRAELAAAIAKSRFEMGLAEVALARAEKAEARIATLEALAEMAAAPGLTLSDIRELLLSEANEDSGAVRSCLEGDDDDGDINVVDTICEMCSRLRHLTEEKAALQAERDGLAQDATFEAEQKEIEDARTDALVKKHAEAAARAGLDVEPIGDMGFIFQQIEAEWVRKASPAKKATAPVEKPVDTRAHVATRRDAHGRRFWSLDDEGLWVANLDEAIGFTLAGWVTAGKPRGSRLVARDDVPALLAEDAAKDAAKASVKQQAATLEDDIATLEDDDAAAMPDDEGGAA